MGLPFYLPDGVTIETLWAWLKANHASVYYHDTLKIWIAADSETARLGNSPEEALCTLATGPRREQPAWLKKRNIGRIPTNAKRPPTAVELDTLSALQHLGCSRVAAEEAVRKARERGAPEEFEPLFRAALAEVRSKKDAA